MSFLCPMTADREAYRNQWMSEHNEKNITAHMRPLDNKEGEKWRTLSPIWFKNDGTKVDSTKVEEDFRLVNMQTLEMYVNFTGCLISGDPRLVIWEKCVILTIVRPIHTLIKTAYHIAFPLSLPIEMFQAILKSDTNNESAKDITYKVFVYAGSSLLDIVRTPVCGIALCTIHAFGALIAPFLLCCHNPDVMYDVRAAAAKVERLMNWDVRCCKWTLTPCFHPTDVFSFYTKLHSKQIHSDTTYENDDAIWIAMNNYVRHKNS